MSTQSETSENGSNGQNGQDTLKATPLWALHKERRAKMVPFSGYEMPLQYRRGIMAEHKHTRERAGLFDVSHMGQAFLRLEGDGGHDEIAAAIETLVPGEIKGLKPGGIRYTLLLNDEGGIMDDLMITRPEGEENEGTLFLVVNAATRDADFAYIEEKLEGKARLVRSNDRALIALQGPRAARALSKLAPFVEEMSFMSAKACRVEGIECIISRCGYTGEDGFEISLPNEMAEVFARKILTNRQVALIGLGARDSLRLEAGLCLYGHDIDEATTPAEAGLAWAIGKRRKIDKDFPGAERIMDQVLDGSERRRVGIKPEGRAPAREGTDIVDGDGKVVGKVTSGGFGPTVRGPVAMGYVTSELAEEGTEVGLMVRGQSRQAEIVAMPFVEPGYHRPGQEKPKRRARKNPTKEAEAEDVDSETPENVDAVDGGDSDKKVIEIAVTESTAELVDEATEVDQDPVAEASVPEASDEDVVTSEEQGESDDGRT